MMTVCSQSVRPAGRCLVSGPGASGQASRRSRAARAGILLAALTVALPVLRAARPWAEMDYGPFLTATIEAPRPEPNFAYKGIAVRLGEAFGGSENEAIVFDTDLVRYSVGWTGNYVALKGVVFDGEHWAYPEIDGDQVFGNPMLPGWAKQGSFADPREYPYGPVPDDWAHWEGIYLHERKVVLSYTVGNMRVREMPGLERAGEVTAFARTLNLGPAVSEQILQVAFEPERRLSLLPSPGAGLSRVAVLPPPVTERPRKTEVSDAGLAGWFNFDAEGEGGLRNQGQAGGEMKLTNARLAKQGQAGRGLQFSGEAAAELPLADVVDFLERDLTVAAWIKTKRDGTILSKTAPTGKWVRNGKTFFVRGGKLGLDIGWVGAVEGRAKVADDRWHHVALTYGHGDGAVRLYVDGRLDGEGKLKPKAAVSGHVVRLGRTAPDFPRSPWFRGAMDDVRIYTRRLAEDEINLLAGGKPADTRALMAVVVGAPAGGHWVTDAPGHLRYAIPAAEGARRFKVLLWRGPAQQAEAFRALARAAQPAPDLTPFTRGGPPRWGEKLVTHGRLGDETNAYAVDRITAPDDNPWKSWLRFGGVDHFADGRRAAICTWNGDVWIVDGIDGDLKDLTWQRVATGLFQPLGLQVVNDEIYVLGRDQITRLHDLNGDGEADFYENFNNDCMVSEHFHEFATDLKTDAEGNFWYVKCACHAIKAKHPHHGTLLKLPPDGSRLEVVARGFRAVNGLGIGPHGEIVTVDNQGYWMPGNRINWVKPGGWYGNQLAWNPENRQTYDEPLCWMHNFVDRSGGTFLWVPDQRWGPLTGQIISISYGMGYITMVLPEEVNGQMQGGVTRFPMEFDTGVMRGFFHPGNGQLYTCGLFGWSSNKTRPGGFYRVRYTGKPVRLANELHIVRDGVVVGFTDPLDPDSATDPGNYSIQAWNYHWTANYGSPDFRLNGEKGRDTWPVTGVSLSADHRKVFLRVPDVQPVMQMHLIFNLRTADGAPLRSFIHNTIHEVADRSGADLLGAGSVSVAQRNQPRLGEETPGLLQTITRLEGAGRSDTRVVRLPAAYLPAGAAPTPWLPAGRFRSVWRGYLKSPLNDEIRFHLAARGRATLRLNGAELLTVGPAETADAVTGPIRVRRGLNPFELTLESRAVGDTWVRLRWESAGIPLEPVPATAFVHDGRQPEALRAVAVRDGRALFGNRLCIKCHQPEAPAPVSELPELAADAPALDGIGARLNPDWIVRHLVDPRADRPDSTMPRVLRGHRDTVLQQAADIAAFLATRTGDTAPPPAPTAAPRAGLPADGDQLFADLGCVACHRRTGDPELRHDPRISLAHVPAKWRRAALTDFLLQPNRHFTWTRMPDFPLTREQAAALTERLMAQHRPEETMRLPDGDAARGRELVQSTGCLNCHTLEGLRSTLEAPSLRALAGKPWRSGCVAGNPADLGRAPDFVFNGAERTALRAFARTDWLASLARRAPDEFAERQIAILRCNACHTRDGQPEVWTQVNALTGTAEADSAATSVDTEDTGEPGGSVHVGRPLLSFSGEKLHAEWMRRFLTGRLPYKPRSERSGFMPAFPAQGALLADGLARQHGFPSIRPPRPAADAALAAVGEILTHVGEGFGCVSCHDVGARKALAGADTATVNFAFVADRLLPSYYRRYLRDPQRLVPGTMMPTFIGPDGKSPIQNRCDGDPDRQFTAIWNYLLSLHPDMIHDTPPADAPKAPTPAAPGDYE